MVHQSQLEGRPAEDVEGFVKDMARDAASDQEYSYAESFRKVNFRT